MASEDTPRSASLTVPAQAAYLSLARLALSAICELAPAGPEDASELKLALTEAASRFVDDGPATAEPGAAPAERVRFTFTLDGDTIAVGITGKVKPGARQDEQELSRAIVEATVDESRYEAESVELVKRLQKSAG